MRLKELRKEKNLSQNEIAKAIGTSQTNIGRWENETNEPASSFIIKLADYFNVSTDYLLGREDDFGNIVLPHEPEDVMTKDEKRLIAAFRKLVPNMQSYMLANIEMLAAQNG